MIGNNWENMGLGFVILFVSRFVFLKVKGGFCNFLNLWDIF